MVKRQNRCISDRVELTNDMLSRAPNKSGSFEVDEPTQKFSRVAIERMRRVAELDDDGGGVSVEEWFELDGRRLRVSLESFAHFGLAGTPLGMVGAVHSCFVSGGIGGEEFASAGPRLHGPGVNSAPVPAPAAAGTHSPWGRHKRVWTVLAASSLAVALATWLLTRTSATQVAASNDVTTPTRAVTPGSRPVLPVNPDVGPLEPEPAAAPEPAVDEANEVVVDEDALPSNVQPRKALADSDVCIEHRNSATRAKERGNWKMLEELAKRRKCWGLANEAKALQMQALFELGRFEECIELGARGGSREMQKWVNNCRRAQK
jgi:hypothetical protein